MAQKGYGLLNNSPGRVVGLLERAQRAPHPCTPPQFEAFRRAPSPPPGCAPPFLNELRAFRPYLLMETPPLASSGRAGHDGPPFYAWFIKRDPGTGARTHHIHMVEGHFAQHWDRLLFRVGYLLPRMRGGCVFLRGHFRRKYSRRAGLSKFRPVLRYAHCAWEAARKSGGWR